MPGVLHIPCPNEATFTDLMKKLDHSAPASPAAAHALLTSPPLPYPASPSLWHPVASTHAFPEGFHACFEFPDNPPRRGPRRTTVHRFMLPQAMVAARGGGVGGGAGDSVGGGAGDGSLNMRLALKAKAWRHAHADRGVRVSNVGGGSFHSPEEPVPLGSSTGPGGSESLPDWCDPELTHALESAVKAAIAAESARERASAAAEAGAAEGAAEVAAPMPAQLPVPQAAAPAPPEPSVPSGGGSGGRGSDGAPASTRALRATGWFNATASDGAHNALHDHGEASWSVVYFAAFERGAADSGARGDGSVGATTDTGSSTDAGSTSTGSSATDTNTCADAGFLPLSRHAGHLLLRFQLAPFTQHFGFAAVPPEPGTLWLFPGHVSHAVAPLGPVAASRGDGGGGGSSGSGDGGDRDVRRLSIAFNIFM